MDQHHNVTIPNTDGILKESDMRFSTSGFFMNQFSQGPQVNHGGYFKFLQ